MELKEENKRLNLITGKPFEQGFVDENGRVFYAYVNKIGNDGSGHRLKATYVQHPHYPKNEKFQEFIDIRPKRRIEKEDIERIWPEWNAEEF